MLLPARTVRAHRFVSSAESGQGRGIIGADATWANVDEMATKGVDLGSGWKHW
jgi:hypothetical protein